MENVHAVADRTTLAAAVRGERDALVAVWRMYQPQLIRFLRARRCATPEDVASQVWIDVGRTIARFVGDGRDFQRWIFTIARRRDIDEARRSARRPELLDDGRREHPNLAEDDDAIGEIGSLDRAIEIVGLLPADMADAVMLRVVYDMSVTEVAAAMQRSEGNVRVLVHRGLTRLRATLTDGGPVPGRRDVKIPSAL